MPKCIINNQEVEFQQGQNIIEVARSIGVMVPYFCYHPGLSVVAQCRMCSVEIEKMPKLQTACSTLAAEGMKISTQSEKVKNAQASTMEFLLANHPLDCPICDKSGECDLQDHSFDFGDTATHYAEQRRTYLDVDMGSVIKKNMNRCIHCTRCIRFGDEIAQIREMVAVHRGNNTEITTMSGEPLETLYSGNYADICPTGSLTLKDFRFHKRVWFLKKTKTICEGCSQGCSLELHHENNVIYRCVAAENPKVNQYWICDEGRFRYQNIMSEQRVLSPVSGSFDLNWDNALEKLTDELEEKKKIFFLIGSDLMLEEMQAIQHFAEQYYPQAQMFSYGSTIQKSTQDGPEDQILRRKLKTANLKSCEKLGLPAFEKGQADMVIFRGGRAQIPEGILNAFGIGLFLKSEIDPFSLVLPLAGFAEKSGTVINHQGLEQTCQQAIEPCGQSKQIGEILQLWAKAKRRKNTAA
jgi:NADH-quinone oxidoreductase subunit G